MASWSISRERVLAGQQVLIAAELADETRWQPQDIELNIVYEDEHILVTTNWPAWWCIQVPGPGWHCAERPAVSLS